MPVARVQLPDGKIGRFDVPDGMKPQDVESFAMEQYYGKQPIEKPGVIEDIVKSLPGAVTRASAAIVGIPETLGHLAEAGGKALGLTPARSFNDLPKILKPGEMVTEGYDKLSEAVTGSPVYRPQTGPGRIADTVAQTVVSGPGSLAAKATMGGAAGLTGEAAKLAGINNPVAVGVLQMLGAGAAGLPFILRNVPAANINDAIKNISPQQLTQAQKLMDDAARMGAPLTGAEAIAQVTGKNTLQDIQRVVEASRKGGPVLQPMMNERPAATRAAFESTADNIGTMPSEPSRTAPRVQAAAEGAIKDARRARSEAAGPFYQRQRDNDRLAVNLEEKLPTATAQADAAGASQASAAQDFGRFKSFENFAEQAANNWHPVEGQPRIAARYSEFPQRAAEGAVAAGETQNLARDRMVNVRAHDANVDAMKRNVDAARTTIGGINDLSQRVLSDIKVVGANSTEGKILKQFYDEIAPGGDPLAYASRVESAYKSSRNQLELPEFGATPIQKTTAGVLGPYVRELDAIVKKASPDIATGRDIYKKMSNDVVTPMEQSPVGDIARTKNLPAESATRAQSEIVMPQAPRALDPPTIHRTVETLKKQDPTAMRDFVRQNVQAIFDESAQNLVGGQNQWGGPKFAAQVAGNPRQRDNLQALVESVSDRQTWNGFNRMLEVLEAQGKRQAPGSQTAFNQKVQGDLSTGGAGTLPAAVASPSKAMSIIGDMYDNFRFGKNTKEMAEILADPKSVDLMRQLAKEAPTSAKAAALTAQIIAGQSPLNSGEQSNTSR